MAIAVLDFISVLAAAFTLVLLSVKKGKKTLKHGTKSLLAGLLLFTLAYNICLFLEWAKISNWLDPLEDYLGALVPMWWGIFFYGLLHDISDYDIRQSEYKYRLIIENQFDFTVKLDPELNILFASPSYCRFLGQNTDGPARKHFLSMADENGSEHVFRALEKVFSPPFTVSYYQQVQTAAGLRWISWRANGVLEGDQNCLNGEDENASHPDQKENNCNGNKKIRYIIAVGRDITEQKEAEQELEKHRDKLEDLVEERTAELQKEIAEREKIEDALRRAKEAAETANQAKSRFLTSMSHELRTPLNAILGFSQLMTRDPAIPPKQQTNLGIINRSGEHLLMLINDVLEMSKIEAGRLTLKPGNVDLQRTLTSIEEMVRSRAEGKGLTFAVDYSGCRHRHIKTDERILRQVLINLLGNAVKFTDRGSVTLRVNTGGVTASGDCDPKDSLLVFEVEDTGPGLLPKDIKHIFDPFFQGAEGRGSGEGTGLGLAISRQFARIMGGDISVESEIDKGSTFKLTIGAEPLPPDRNNNNHPFRKVTGLAPGIPRYRLLIVEDNRSNRELLQQLLELVGFEVNVAVNGAIAVESFKTGSPDLIWMDIHMPVMDGYEATRKIRNLPGGKEVKIIALTASAFFADRQKAIEAGCDDYLRKPFKEEELFEVMARHLDVNYIFDEPEKQITPDTQDANRDNTGNLPEALRAELIKAAENLDIQHVQSLTQQVKRYDEKLAQVLQDAVENLDFEILLQQLDRRGRRP